VALPSHDRPETEALALTRLVRWWGRRYGRPVSSLRGAADVKSSNRRSASLQTRLETLTLSAAPARADYHGAAHRWLLFAALAEDI